MDSKLNNQKLKMIFAVLLLLAPSVFAQCGVGSQCKTKIGVETCTPCPAGTSCSQWTTSSGSLGAFYCQYTVCLAEGAFCNNRVGTCCSGLECSKTSETAVAQTCNNPAPPQQQQDYPHQHLQHQPPQQLRRQQPPHPQQQQ